MKLKFVFFFGFSILILNSCVTDPPFKNKAERFIRDSILNEYDASRAFKLTSIKADSISNHELVRNLKGEYLEELNFLKISKHRYDSAVPYADKQRLEEIELVTIYLDGQISRMKENIDICNKRLLIPDSLNHIKIRVNYTLGKPASELKVDSNLLIYYPQTDSFQLITRMDRKNGMF